jgi:hypothetical protein
MASPIRVIVHSGRHGLEVAADYYKKIPWEPSPAGNLALDQSPIVRLNDATLDSVLDEMIKAGAGATVLLVCHAYGEGLLMPLAHHGRLPAGRTAITKLLEVSSAEGKARAIRGMPERTDNDKKKKIDAWTALTDEIAAGAVMGEVTLQEAEWLYTNWVDGVAKDQLLLGGPSPTAVLKRLVQKVERVQSLNLDRVELRACNIGGFPDAMAKVKQLFGCRSLLAPLVGTFYLSGVPVETLDRFDRRFVSEHRRGGFRYPGPAGRFEELGWDPPEAFALGVRKANPGMRIFWDVQSTYIPPANPHPSPHKYDGGTSVIKMRQVFAMIVEEVSPFWYRGSAATWHESKRHGPLQDDAQTFVHDYIMGTASYKSGSLTVAGFWTPGGGMPWLLPNEPEYVQQITQA